MPAGVAHLSKLQQLTQLDLAYTTVTDASVSNLQQLTSLIDLNLDSCSLTDRWAIQGLSAVFGIAKPMTSITRIGLAPAKSQGVACP